MRRGGLDITHWLPPWQQRLDLGEQRWLRGNPIGKESLGWNLPVTKNMLLSSGVTMLPLGYQNARQLSPFVGHIGGLLLHSPDISMKFNLHDTHPMEGLLSLT